MKTEQWKNDEIISKATEGASLIRRSKQIFFVELWVKLQFEREIGKTSVTCIILSENQKNGQANKSARGMPWHQEPKKDVTSCDKLRGAAHTH